MPGRASKMLSVVVPKGARAGDQLRFTIRGETVSATVPGGKRPGDAFEVPIPRDDDEDDSHAPPPADTVAATAEDSETRRLATRVARLDEDAGAALADDDALDDLD